jgi:outer membrane protein OmpA-like peptidoglycan-associated protein
MVRFFYILFTVFLYFTENLVFAQKTTTNLIIDGSFEDYQDCPDEFGSVRIGSLKYWKANPPDCTPDFFHSCSKTFHPENNPCGSLKPQHGKGYLGLIVRVGASPEKNTDELFYREHVQARLREPLKHRNRYVFTMYVSLSEYSSFAMSKIGVYFSQQPVLVSDKTELRPQVESDFIDTKKEWLKITDTIVAEGNEQYITLGDFTTFSKKDIRKIEEKDEYKNYFSYHRAYYFFDNLSLVWLDALADPILLDPPQPPYKLTAPRELTGWEKPWQLEPTEFGYLEPNKPIVLKNVLFQFGKAVLLEESQKELDKLLRLLNEYKEIKIMISGHTDEIGKVEENLKLSDSRAKSVHEYLVKKGISENRLFYRGYGSSQPLENNKTEAGRRKNRRVEFFIIDE